MGKFGGLITLGIVVTLVPLLGIPDAWKAWIYTALGIGIVVLAYLARRAHRQHGTTRQRTTDTFSENTPHPIDTSMYARTDHETDTTDDANDEDR